MTKKQKDTSTKKCPSCGSTALILLTSQNVKLCSECPAEIPWKLDKGQKPIH